MWQSGVQKCVHSLKGLINEAYKAFDSTAKRRWMPDATAYNVIIHGHCRAGNLCAQMVQDGFLLSAITTIKGISQFDKDEELN